MKIILGLVSLLIVTPAIAQSVNPDKLTACFEEAANQKALPEQGVSNINVNSSFVAGDVTYYYAQVIAVNGTRWGTVVQQSGSSCSYVGDNYVADFGLYGNMPTEVVRDWTIKRIKPTIDKIGKKQFQSQIKDPSFQWHPGEVEAFKSLGVW